MFGFAIKVKVTIGGFACEELGCLTSVREIGLLRIITFVNVLLHIDTLNYRSTASKALNSVGLHRYTCHGDRRRSGLQALVRIEGEKNGQQKHDAPDTILILSLRLA